MVDFLFALIELFSLCITIPELRGEMSGQGHLPRTILGIRKLDTGLPDGEDRIHVPSF